MKLTLILLCALVLSAPAYAGHPGRNKCHYEVICGPGKSGCKKVLVCKKRCH